MDTGDEPHEDEEQTTSSENATDEPEPPAFTSPTLRDVLRGDPVAPSTTAHLNSLLGDMNSRVGKFDFAAGKVIAPTSRVAQSYLQQQAEARHRAKSVESALAEGLAAQRAERQRELDWRANLLAQQRITAQVLTEMNTASAGDRHTNVLILRTTIAALVVGIIGILVAVIIAILQ